MVIQRLIRTTSLDEATAPPWTQSPTAFLGPVGLAHLTAQYRATTGPPAPKR